MFVIATLFGVWTTVTTEQKLKSIKMSTISDENFYKIGMENAQKQSLYLTCDALKNIDANLGKVAISHNTQHQAELLTDVAICASEVSCQLANLPIEKGEKLAQCEKFANQTQDYATYLVGRLAASNQLEKDERAALKNLQRVARNLYDVMQKYAESDSAMFITNGTGADGVGDLTDMLNSAQDDAFEYEKLIYDGPFSDSIEHKQLSCGKKITHEQGSKIVEQHFGKNKFSREIKQKCPLYVYKTDKGEVTLASDGRVVEYEATQVFDGAKVYDGKQCIKKAE
ncbi:MAG: germination protein YpeB, partial [Clostridia bacterium]|nr:germination protein YpeB [Clostridia bacterium]